MAEFWSGLFTREVLVALIAAALCLGGALATLRLMTRVFGDRSRSLVIAGVCGAAAWSALLTGFLALGLEPFGWAAPHAALLALALAVATLAGAASAICDVARRSGRSGLGFQTLSEASVEALAICDDGVIVDVNRSFEDLSGLSRKSAVGRRLSDVAPSFMGPLAARAELFEAKLPSANGDVAQVEVLRRALDRSSGRCAFAIRDLRDRRTAETSIEHLTHCDPLTGVLNRASFARAFDHSMASAARAGGAVGLLVIDLLEFTDVNDKYGHHAGDDVLRRIAARLDHRTSELVTIGRLNGDVFGALIAPTAGFAEVTNLAQEWLDEVQAPIDEVFGVTVSALIGAVVVAPSVERDLTFPNALGRAEAALARAKRANGAAIRFYDEEIDDSIRRRRALGQDLRCAIDRRELLLHYQPQASVDAGEVTGFEALLRWAHPQRGLVSPVDFIPIAEETGLIGPIGAWALRQACLDAARWPENFRISVNLSPVQIREGELIEMVRAVLEETGIKPSRLELEVTESMIIEDVDHATKLLRGLKELGITIAIDDFGTGYASLATLQSFPFDKIKLDRTFLQHMDANRQSAAIVQAVIALGAELEMDTLAEGVETQNQLETLRRLGCNEFQGYLLGRPAPLELLGEHLNPKPLRAIG